MAIYYTDFHNVDEDLRAISTRGGEWGQYWHETYGGVFTCAMLNTPTESGGNVASRCRHLRLIKYYTEWYDADEDAVTISVYGAGWVNTVHTGVFRREINFNVDYISGLVASSDISKLIKYYTDTHNVDEDMLTIAGCSGAWMNSTSAGIAYRFMWDSPSSSGNDVASLKKNKNSLSQ